MQLYQYSPIDGNRLINVKNNQIFFNIVNKVNDPYEGMLDFKVKSELNLDFIKLFFQHRYNEEIFNKYSFDEIKRIIIFDNVNTFLMDVGISCFSEVNDSLIMWGNYANNHKGMCIGYDSSVGIFAHAEKVCYSKTIFTLNINKKNEITEDFILKNAPRCMYSKYKEWEYEKEWRIIFKPLQTFQNPSGAIKSICFGLRTSEEDIRKVREAAKHHKGLKYFKATINPHEYKLVYNEIIFKE